jgi:hypothetical protein
MTDQSAYGGLFQDPPYLSSDADPQKTDPYDRQDCIPSRYLGKSMTVGGRVPPGDLPDAYFDKQYLTLASAEQNGGKPVGYDEDKWKKAAAEQHKKNAVSDKEFRYSSYPQKSTGPGSYFGCFQDKPYEYMTEPWDEGSKKRKRGKSTAKNTEVEKTHLPNIKTSRPKKGTYGYPGLLLENPTYNENWKAEHDAAEREAAKRAQRAAAGKPLGPPLRISGVSRAYLDEQPNTGVSGVYAQYIPPQDSAAAKKRKSKKAADGAAGDAPAARHEKPFIASASRSGEQGCINSFPNMWVSPDDVKPSKAAQQRQAQREKEEAARAAKALPVWKPNSFEKTSVISSCLRRFY